MGAGLSVEAESAGVKPPRHRFAVLDGMRALAALMVVSDHVQSETLKALLPHRAMAVDFFFVLSGFVVIHAYGQRLAGPNPIGVFKFMRLRLVRFWPMLLAAFALAILSVSLREPGEHSAAQWFVSIALGLMFLPTPQDFSLHSWTPFPLVGPAYSMFFELFANLMLAVSIARLGPRLLGLIIAIGALGIAAIGLRHGSITVGWHYGDFLGGFVRVVFSFFVGVALYRFWRSHKVPALPVWAAFVILFVLHAMPALGVWFGPYQIVVALVVFPLLVLFSAGAEVKGLAERLCLRFGALSYGFYLLHEPLNELIEWVFNNLSIAPVSLDVALFVLVVTSALLLTMLVERFYETPFRRWLGAHVRAGSRPAAPTG